MYFFSEKESQESWAIPIYDGISDTEIIPFFMNCKNLMSKEIWRQEKTLLIVLYYETFFSSCPLNRESTDSV
jgi:hypothetical protein